MTRYTLLASLAAATLLATLPAHAQSGGGQDGPNDRFRSSQDDGDRDRSDDRRGERWRDRDHHWGMGWGYADGGRGHGRRWRDDDGDEGRGRGGAAFMLRSGDVRLAVRCGPSESMRACVEAATMLMDRARSAGGSGTTTGPSSDAPRP